MEIVKILVEGAVTCVGTGVASLVVAKWATREASKDAAENRANAISQARYERMIATYAILVAELRTEQFWLAHAASGKSQFSSEFAKTPSDILHLACRAGAEMPSADAKRLFEAMRHYVFDLKKVNHAEAIAALDHIIELANPEPHCAASIQNTTPINATSTAKAAPDLRI